jgi:hypothetical protein
MTVYDDLQHLIPQLHDAERASKEADTAYKTLEAAARKRDLDTQARGSWNDTMPNPARITPTSTSLFRKTGRPSPLRTRQNSSPG